MIYEGAVIRRLVTPNHPGDPTLDDPTTESQFRVEYVKNDKTAPRAGSWTRDIGAAHIYPRHLEANRRAIEIDPHSFARVLPKEEKNFETQGGAVAARLAHNQKAVGSSPTPATNLPVAGSSSARAVKQLPRLGTHGTSGSNQSTSAPETRAIGKAFSKRRRVAALRGAVKRLDAPASSECDRTWYRTGQYA